MQKSGDKFTWNIPNVLSLYRILAVPVMLYVVYTADKSLFTILLCINLLTDILDGYIARRFNMATSFGARLDSVADICTYVCAAAGLIRFEWGIMADHYIPICLFAAVYIAGNIIGFVRFGRIAALHLYIFKLTGYMQGLFVVVLFCFGFYAWFFYLTAVLGIYACVEEIIVMFMLSEPNEHAKGLYWLLKEKQ